MNYILNRKFLNIIKFLFISFFILLSFKVIKPNKKPIFIFNHASMVIMTASMEPEYLTNSFIIIKKESINALSVGDVIAYKSDALNGNLAFHRIIRITSEGIYTKGDNNNLEDNQIITADTYIGKCVFHTNIFAQYMTIIKSPNGFIILFLLPLFLIALFLFLIRKLLQMRRTEEIYENII